MTEESYILNEKEIKVQKHITDSMLKIMQNEISEAMKNNLFESHQSLVKMITSTIIVFNKECLSHFMGFLALNKEKVGH